MTLLDLRGPVRVTIGLHRRVLWAALALVLLAAIALPAGRWYIQSLAEDLAATGRPRTRMPHPGTVFSTLLQWHEVPVYQVIGPVAVSYALLGVAVGTLAGLLIGRTVPAMAAAVTMVGIVTAALVLTRPWFWPTLDGPARGGEGNISGPVDFIGTRYHPESHFWPLQPVESALVPALAAAAIVAAFALLRRRHR